MIFYYEAEEISVNGEVNVYCGYAAGYCLEEINTDILNRLGKNGIFNITKIAVEVINDYSISVTRKTSDNHIYKNVYDALSDNYRKENK